MAIKEIVNILEEYKGKELIIEFGGTGSYFDGKTEIKYTIQTDSNNKNNIGLRIWDCQGQELCHVYENWFKLPSKKQFEKIISNINENRGICHYWSLMKSKDNLPDILIIDYLSSDNYRKAIALQSKYKMNYQ